MTKRHYVADVVIDDTDTDAERIVSEMETLFFHFFDDDAPSVSSKTIRTDCIDRKQLCDSKNRAQDLPLVAGSYKFSWSMLMPLSREHFNLLASGLREKQKILGDNEEFVIYRYIVCDFGSISSRSKWLQASVVGHLEHASIQCPRFITRNDEPLNLLTWSR